MMSFFNSVSPSRQPLIFLQLKASPPDYLPDYAISVRACLVFLLTSHLTFNTLSATFPHDVFCPLVSSGRAAYLVSFREDRRFSAYDLP